MKGLGYFRAFVTEGVDPAIMGIGPIPAVRKLLRKTGLKMSDIDIFEVNEAFGSQAVYVQRTLEIPLEKLNVNGGAIALGHPLGCTGAKLAATALLRASPPRRPLRHRHDVHRRRHGRSRLARVDPGLSAFTRLLRPSWRRLTSLNGQKAASLGRPSQEGPRDAW